MNYEHIVLRKEEGIATITLNRPQKLNALTYTMMNELIAAFDDASSDNNIRVVVLTGAGRSFCAGADFRFAELKEGKIGFSEVEELDVQIRGAGGSRGRLTPIVAKAILAIQQIEKPVIAMIRGDVIGGGVGLSLACDMRVGENNTRFMIGYPRIGYPPDMGESWMLPRVVGLGKALEIIMTCDFVSAEESYRIGLLNKLVAADDLENETRAMAQKIIKVPPFTQRFIKQQVYGGLQTDLRSSMQFAYAGALLCMGVKDHEEALLAFAERREPIYKDTPVYE
ncbi:enoyl-CoA hydratase/isomerase family protein [Chloroflexota bacterium]